MIIDRELCIGCGDCVPYCTMGAITLNPEGYSEVDQDECVECNSCLRAEVCAVDAIQQQALGWPRELRAQFSDPLGVHPNTGVPGRGTEEIKTNDYTGRVLPGFAGIAVELGRPSVGVRLRDVEKVAMALSSIGVEHEPCNPVTHLMTDKATGKMREDVLGEKALSAIIEFIVPFGKVVPVLKRLKEVSAEVDTVFSVDLAFRPEMDGSQPLRDSVAAAGFPLSINGKTNVGMVKGRF